MKKPNKDEECNNLIGADGAGCQYFKNTAQRMYGQQSSLALQVIELVTHSLSIALAYTL